MVNLVCMLWQLEMGERKKGREEEGKRRSKSVKMLARLSTTLSTL